VFSVAAVLVRNDGVIAVTARPQADDDSEGNLIVEVLAFYLVNVESLTHTISQPGVSALRSVIISQNPRDSTVKWPVVVDPETSAVPNDFKMISGNPSKLLNTFLEKIW
jgi:hypothetical protein